MADFRAVIGKVQNEPKYLDSESKEALKKLWGTYQKDSGASLKSIHRPNLANGLQNKE